MKKTVWNLILLLMVFGITCLFFQPCMAQDRPPLKEEDLTDEFRDNGSQRGSLAQDALPGPLTQDTQTGSLAQDSLLGQERAMYIYGECINPKGDWELGCIEQHRLVRDQCRLQCKDRCCLIECERQHELFCCERCLGGVWSPLPLPNCKQPLREDRLP